MYSLVVCKINMFQNQNQLVRMCCYVLQEKQPVVCHRDGNMRNGVIYSVLKDGLQFLAVVSTSNAVPGTHAAFVGTIDYFR